MNKHLFLLFLLQIATFWAYGQCGSTVQGTFTAAINATPTGATACNGQTMEYNFSASPAPAGNQYTYSWNFGQPSSGSNNTATTATASHTFGSNSNAFTAGTYTVTLVVIDTTGAIDYCDATTITVNTGPDAPAPTSPLASLSFTATLSATSCNGLANQYSFTPSVTGSQYIYSWNFGQSGATNTSTLANPTHTFGSNSNNFSASTYTVTLYVIDIVGNDTCKMVSQSVTSNPIVGNPANFTWNPNSPCSGTTAINFSGSPASNNQNKYIYSWNFAGLGTASIKNPTFTFPFNASPQTYTVSFMAIDTTGRDTCRFIQHNITVNPATVIQVDTTNFNICEPGLDPFTQNNKTVTFNVTPPTTGVFSWTVTDLLNSTTSSFPNSPDSLTYSFPHFGSYTISVFLPGSPCPGFSKTFKFYTNPIASMSLQTNPFICEGDTVRVINNSVPGTSDYFVWDWGDGAFTTVQDTARQKHVYNLTASACAGTQMPLTLYAYNACFLPHSNSSPITIKPKPRPDLSFPPIWCVNTPVTFVNQTCPSTNAGGAMAYTWSWGDGSTTITGLYANQTHTYTTVGTFTITLIATKVNGCSAGVITKDIVITGFPVANASFAASDSNYCLYTGSPLVVNATNISTPSTPALSYSWAATGATPSSSILTNPTFSYSGTYTGVNVITLYATNVCGTDTMQKQIRLKRLPTNALANIPNHCLISPNLTVDITPNPTYTLGNSINPVYAWTFTTGVPPTSSLSNPTNITFAAGNHTVQNIVTNECGSDMAARTFTVTDFPQALANFTLSDTNYCTSSTQPLTISFTGQALPTGATYNWVAPNATIIPSATSPNPVFTYPASVNYSGLNTITLTVTAPNGCGTNQQVFSFRVKKAPIVTLNNITDQCLTASTTTINVTPSASYTLGNSANPVYAWTFSGCTPPTASTATAPTISCPLGGHNVTISISNECGTVTATDTFTVNAFPDANATLSFNPANNCAVPGTPLVVTVNNLSTPSTGITPIWSAGAGGTFVSPTTSSSMNPVISYATSGIPTISLTYSNVCGTDTWSQNITVKTLPTININLINAPCLTATSSTISLAPSAVFSASNGTFGATAFSWNFGTTAGINPTSSTLQNPGSVTFPAGNNYYWVSATNECGTTTKNDSILVGDFPHADASFVINHADSCTSVASPFIVNFTSLSTPMGIISHNWNVNPNTGANISNATATNPSITFTQSGDYTVTLTVGNGCGSHQWLQVFRVKARPDISLATINDICLTSGQTSTTITPSPSYNPNNSTITSYNWTFLTPLNSLPTNIANPTNVVFGAGNQLITIIAENVCGKDTASEAFTLTEFPHANVSAAVNDANICTYAATPFQVTLTNNSTPNGIVPNINATNGANVNGNIITMPNIGTSIITINCTNICGTDDTTFTYNVHGLPTVDVPFIPDGCGFVQFNPTATITYGNTNSNAASYNWQFQNGAPFNSASLNPGTVTFSPIICAVSLTVTNVCGSVNDVSNFNIVPPATLVGSNDTVLCSNVAPNVAAISIHCAPAGGQWNNVVSNVNIVGNQSFATFTPSVAGTYYAIYTYGAGNCLRIDTVKIIVNAAPNVDAGLPFAICADAAAVTLSGTPSGGCFTGSGMTNCTQFTPTTVAPSATPYNITYTFTDANQCTSSDQVQITVNPLPVVNAGLDTTFCFTSTPQILVGSSPVNGVWTGLGISNAATGEFIPSVAGVGNHTLLYTFTDGNGCVNKDSIVAHVILKDSVDAGADQSICYNGGILTLTGYYPLSNAVWTGSGVSGNSFDPLITGVATVTLTYTTGVGSCVASDTKDVIIFPVPSVNAGQIVSTCVSDSVVNLANGTPLGGYWTGFTVNSNQFFPNTAGVGTYPITYHFADGNGCIDSNTTNIVVNPLPQVQFSVPLISCKGSLVFFNNQSTGVTQYAWHFGDGGTSFAQNPSYVYADTGHFEVTLIGTSGSSCVDSMKFTLQIIDVPSPSFLMTPDTACSSILANGTGVMASFIDNSLNWGGTYNWNFGNLQNSTLQNPPPIFCPEGLNDTSYVIILDIGNMCGTATFKDTLHILSQPKAIFGTNVNSGCSPAPFLMANISQGGPTAWSWIFGNGNTSTVQNPSVQYYLIGASNLDTTYTITLIASNMCGADTATHQVTVHPNTVNAFFNANPIAGCAPLTVNVTNFSNGNTVSYNMGPAVANPTIIFPNAGTYVIKQYANNGCSYDTAAVTITVNAAPIVSFASQPIICQGDTANFTNNTQNAVSYSWNFGDNTTLGDTSNAVNPLYIYPTAGNQVVTLTAYANTTLCAASASQTINVKPAPSIDFALSDTIGCAAFVVNVLNNTSSGTFHFWDFGAAFPNTSNIANPTFACQTQGTYPIHYTNTNGFGCHSDTTFSVVAVEKPLAAFTPSALSACGTPATFNFSNQSTGTNIAYSWNFGNAVGTQSNLPTPSVTYTNTGTFTVTLIVGNNFGCSDTLQIPITVYPQPNANFSISPTQGCAPLTVSFTNTTTNATNYTWTFGNGSPINTSFAPPAQTYLVQSSYPITLYANYQNQCFDSATITLPVLPPPVANFNFSTSGNICGGAYTLNFNNLSQNGSVYSWNFGDGGTDTVTNPIHTYNGAGTYIISLTALNGVNCLHTFKDTIVVHPQPNVNVLVQPTVGCAPLTTTFVNLSTNYTTTSWYYGDNSTPSPFVGNSSPSHTYAIPDTYYLQVITNYQNVCFDTLTVPITVVPLPIANFTYSPTTVVCGAPAPFTFVNSSQMAQNYFWKFGNGMQTTAFDPTVIYTAADTFVVTLISSNALGCKDTMTQNIIVNPQPNASFSVSPTQGCAPLTVNVTNATTNATNYSWDWGNAALLNSALQNPPAQIYNTVGNGTPPSYTITLYVNYQNQCFDTASVTIPVLPQPISDFNFTTSGTYCAGPYTLTFNNLSQNSTHHSWNFGNGVTDTLANPTYTYNNVGTYIISLTSYNDYGCTHTSFDTITVHPQPQALLSATPTVGCVPAILTVQNLSTFANAWTWNFGDGTAEETAFVPMPHTYFVPANDTLTLIANYQNVCFDTLRVLLSYGDRPNAIFVFSVSGDLCGGPVQIVTDNQSTLATSYLWDFGDGLNYSTQFNDSVIYPLAGDYMISLIATNAFCSDTSSQNYHLYDQVTANFIADTLAGCNPQPIAFSSTSINATDFAWYFGDTTSSIQNPVLHTYQDSGTYTVTLIASIGGVCPDTITKTGFIHINQSPIAAFDMQPEQTGSFDNVIHFINTTQFANQYLWDLGDGTTTIMETPEPHAYLTNDTAYATLIAINEYGCRDTLVKYVSMKPVYGLQIPNAFAPYSGVAKANVFMPIGYGLKEYEIAVYSTWGDLVWSSTAIDAEGRPTEAWDGKDRNGNPMNSDVFVWEVHKAIFIGNVEWEGMKYGRKKEKAHRTGTLTIVK